MSEYYEEAQEDFGFEAGLAGTADMEMTPEMPGVSETAEPTEIVAQQNTEGEAQAEPTQAEPDTGPAFFDAGDQVRALMAQGHLKPGDTMPREVIARWVAGGGRDLEGAFRDYRAEQMEQARQRTERENRVLRQNLQGYERGVVGGVSFGGAVDERGEDDFTRGFNSYD